jgi:hypothetical protein
MAGLRPPTEEGSAAAGRILDLAHELFDDVLEEQHAAWVSPESSARARCLRIVSWPRRLRVHSAGDRNELADTLWQHRLIEFADLIQSRRRPEVE